MYEKALCVAAHAPTLPKKIRRSLQKAARGHDSALLRAEHALFAADASGRWRALAGTTQAIDLVGGGVKTNALPESAWAVVNHRVATDGSLADVVAHDTAVLTPLAARFNLTFSAFGKVVNGAKGYGTLDVKEAWGAQLVPAPVTPSEGDEAAPFRLLAGTIRATYDAHHNERAMASS